MDWGIRSAEDLREKVLVSALPCAEKGQGGGGGPFCSTPSRDRFPTSEVRIRFTVAPRSALVGDCIYVA